MDAGADAGVKGDATVAELELRLRAIAPGTGRASNDKRAVIGHISPAGGTSTNDERTVRGTLGAPR
jgi:hypothetical protein